MPRGLCPGGSLEGGEQPRWPLGMVPACCWSSAGTAEPPGMRGDARTSPVICCDPAPSGLGSPPRPAVGAEQGRDPGTDQPPPCRRRGYLGGVGVGFALPGMRHVVWSLRRQLGRGRILSPPAAAATCWRHECRWAEETPAGAARPPRPFMGLLSFKAKMSG